MNTSIRRVYASVLLFSLAFVAACSVEVPKVPTNGAAENRLADAQAEAKEKGGAAETVKAGVKATVEVTDANSPIFGTQLAFPAGALPDGVDAVLVTLLPMDKPQPLDESISSAGLDYAEGDGADLIGSQVEVSVVDASNGDAVTLKEDAIFTRPLPDDFDAVLAPLLALIHFHAGAWEPFSSQKFDEAANKFSGGIKTFSPTALVSGKPSLTAIDAAFTTNEDTVLTGTLTAPSSGKGVFSMVATPASGTVVFTDTATGSFTYTPNADANGSDTFTFQIKQNNLVSNTATATLTITPVNDAPTNVSLGNVTVAETAAAGTAVGNLSTLDVDAGSTFTYSLVSGTGSADNASFQIAGGVLQTAATFDFEANSTYSIRIRSTDNGSLFYESPFTIAVNDVNENPSNIMLSNSSVTENTSGAFVGNFSSSDPDAGDTYTYSFTSGTGSADNAAFALVGGVLTTGMSLNYEAQSSYSIRVLSMDAGGLTYAKIFTVTLEDVNEAPTNITLSNASVNEEQPSGTAVGNLISQDEDAGSTFTHTLVAGAGSTDNGSFQIAGGTLKTAAVLDFESKTAYQIRLRTTDNGNATFEKTFTISVGAINETPTAPGVSFLPADYAFGNDLTASVSSASIDPEGSSVSYTFAWYKNTVAQNFSDSQTTVTSGLLVRGDVWKVVVTASDSSALTVTGFAIKTIPPDTGSWVAAGNTNAPAGRFDNTTVWTGSEMIVWGGQSNSGLENTGGRYNPASDTWSATSTSGAPTARRHHTAVWTGREMLVWGSGNVSSTGGRYDPATDSWGTSIATSGAPQGSNGHSGVWTGREMIVWGGNSASARLNTGGRYDPNTDTWYATATTNAPSQRWEHAAVWTDKEMIVWGGQVVGNTETNTGGRYDPTTNSWVATSTSAGVPPARQIPKMVWTGNRMIVWGGDVFGQPGLNTGGQYDPGTDTWSATSLTNAPASRKYHNAVWTGRELIVWGGTGAPGTLFDTGGRYNPNTDTWAATSPENLPAARYYHSAVWTGRSMIVWGGFIASGVTGTGGVYTPPAATEAWVAMSNTGAPAAREYHSAVWTGSEMIVWGGSDSVNFNTGGRYNPSTDTWLATSLVTAPAARRQHNAAWTGREMFIFGGNGASTPIAEGSRYDPSTDSWAATTASNEPAARNTATMVWTGREMIVWGGLDENDYLDTGGRYDPVLNTWQATTLTGVPLRRYWHKVVWSGREMIVWGGMNTFEPIANLSTGGRYDPVADTWMATAVTGAPASRVNSVMLWTGREMLVWGGNSGTLGGRYDPVTNTWASISVAGAAANGDGGVWTGREMIIWASYSSFLNTGGAYNPLTDSWTATTTVNAPAGSYAHTTVWTGREMIVWGGINNTGLHATGGRYTPPLP